MNVKYLQANPQLVDFLSQELELPSWIVKILINRGYTTEEKILDLLITDEEYSDPTKLPDIEKVCQRLGEAIKNQDPITICGDYDVDGTLATVILYRFLKEAGANISHFIPHRTLDGYGISSEIMEKLKLERNTKIVISVDTGTTAFEAAKTAKNLGIDLIVTDHHNLSNEGLPDVFALVNAKRLPQPNVYEQLAGSGVALYLVKSLNKYFEKNNMKVIDEKDFLILAMMATIADVVPLVQDNRVIVKYGLQKFPYCDIPGVQALFEKLNLSAPTAKDIAWRFAPIINAAGRLDSAGLALDLFLENNKLQSIMKAKDLINLNQKRRKISEDVTKKALELAEIEMKKDPAVLVVAGPFHVGVIGISAAKVVDKYHRPAIVIGFDASGYGKASARSIEGFSVKDIIDATKGYHLGGGGHDMAAGFSINESQLEDFKKQVDIHFPEIKLKETDLMVEAVLRADEVTKDSIKALSLMAPFGQNNKFPAIEIRDLKISETRTLRGDHQLIIFENEVEGIIFKNSGISKYESVGQVVNVIGLVEVKDGIIKIEIKKIIEKERA